jgi:hypothetical protein
VDHDETQDTTRTAQADDSSSGARLASSARTLAIIALVVALTAPFWEEALLGSINIHLPVARELAETARGVDKLERRTVELEQQLGATTTQLGRLQAQLTQAVNQANAAADRVSTLAMMELTVALRRPGGFELELAALRAATPDLGDLKPLLDQIEPYAVTGVPSAAQIRQDFSRISTRIQWAERGYISVAWVTRLFPWPRKTAAQPAAVPDNTSQVLTQAGTQIGSGDLAGAVSTVQQIGGSHQEALADWIEDANARVAADAVAQRLNDQIVQRAGRTTPQKPGKT